MLQLEVLQSMLDRDMNRDRVSLNRFCTIYTTSKSPTAQPERELQVGISGGSITSMGQLRLVVSSSHHMIHTDLRHGDSHWQRVGARGKLY